MSPSILQGIKDGKARGEKKFVVLIDPDKLNLRNVDEVIRLAVGAGVDYFFVGGSLVTNPYLDETIAAIKAACHVPVILFPGSPLQISEGADALLLLSLISGRNAELLIGRHVEAAPFLKRSGLEIMSTGYMLVDGGAPTTVSYISNTTPIPADKEDIAVCTAMAGEMLGNQLIYLDAGSGARHAVSERMLASVSRFVAAPIIVGGGIRNPEQAMKSARAGADLIVVGNAIEADPLLVTEMASAVHGASTAAVK